MGDEAEKRFVNDLCELIHGDSGDEETTVLPPSNADGATQSNERKTFTAPEFVEWMQREYRRKNKV